MKNQKNIILIFSIIFIIIGIIIVIISLLLGAKFDNRNSYNFVQSYYEEIDNIEINIDAGEIIIKEGEAFKMYAENIIEGNFNSKIENKTWKIENTYWRRFFDNLINLGISYNPKITIYLPDTMLEEFNIDIGAGKGTITKVSTKKININVGTGSLEIKDLYSEKSNIDCGVGEINIAGKMLGYNKIDNGVGSIELNLIGNEKNYNYKYDIGIGEVRINNISYSKISGNNYINNNALNDFDIDCGVGSIEIDIKE